MVRPRSNVTALQGNYSKEFLQKRLEQEKSITGDSDNIIIPKFIEKDEIAVEEYLRIVQELQKVNLVTNVDCTLLGIYADSYSKYVESTMCMLNEPLVTEYTNKGGATNPVINPYIKVQQQYATMLMKISSLYGLDPASRSKIAHLTPSNKEEEVDPLTAMLAELKGNSA
ncbi:phage terminase small subunit P27 family [Terrisporobacter sp.]|uniref:phage terminase small subunit P27 family n=1 Tax=Terrisporobacter sp. TaxID=1965305 RepID=UPI002050F6CA|nr:MAG TPA: terminase small subunit [Caudoviricetes sp.]